MNIEKKMVGEGFQDMDVQKIQKLIDTIPEGLTEDRFRDVYFQTSVGQ